MSCCPPNAEKYLAATYDTTGETVTLASGTEIYLSGSATESKKAVLVIPDVWGWNGGRTRNIADMFAEAGYLAVVPKLMVPPLEGGTDGDGLFPTFDFAVHGAQFGPYMKQFDWQGCLDARIADAVAFLKAEGAEKIATIGFCWGGWVMAHALCGPSADDFVCGVSPHPSMQLENMVHGRDTLALFSAVNKPLLLLPAKGDSADYYADGAWFQAAKQRFPSSESHNYLDFNHGFVPRGDINDPAVKQAVEDVLTRTFAFFAAHV